MPFVATVLTPTQFTTLRARDNGTRGFDYEHETAVALDDDQDDAPPLRLCPNRRDHRDSPRRPRDQPPTGRGLTWSSSKSRESPFRIVKTKQYPSAVTCLADDLPALCIHLKYF